MKKWTFAQRVQRWVTRNLLTRVMRVQIEGLENLPASGPYILIWNHLHITDGMLLWSGVPQPVVFLASDKFKGKNWLVHMYLRGTGAILVRDGGNDRQAIKRALSALREGCPLAIAPEGRVSRTGALCEAQPGIASLVLHSGAAVVPVAIWGQHRAHEVWRRWRRPRVTIRYAAARTYAHRSANAANLRLLTTEIMNDLALALPPEYRGVYSGCETREEAQCV